MTFFEHWQFFLALTIVLIIAMLLGCMEINLRHYRLMTSIAFILIIFGQTPVQLLYFITFVVIEWILLLTFLTYIRKNGRKDPVYFAYLVSSLLPLILSKLQTFMNLGIFCFIGISYITFKVVQILIEIYDGVIKELHLYDYLNFLLFFPTISSGPIDRSRRFLEDQNTVLTREAYLDMAMPGVTKLLLGYIYKAVIASRIYLVMTACLDMLANGAGISYEVGYAYLYGFYLFFDFAGYSLMAVGTSYILGIRTPDNFRQPFLAKDIKDFWDRWHISLSHWFRDFIFTRLVMRFKKQKWFRTRLTRANICFIINMTIMGIWHGLDWSYIIYGLYHGILLALTETWQKKSTFYKKHREQGWYQFLSWIITMQLYIFGFYIFSGRLLTVLTMKL